MPEVVHALVNQGLLSQNDGESALNLDPGACRRHPLVTLAEQQYDDLSRPGQRLVLESLTLWLALHAGQAYWRIDALAIDLNALTALLPRAFAQRHGILIVGEAAASLIVASAQPFIGSWVPALSQALKRPIKRAVANPLEIQRSIEQLYKLARSVNDASAGPVNPPAGALAETGAEVIPDIDDTPIVNIVDWLLQHALDQRASDIHIEPRRDQGTVRLRIDGQLQDIYRFQPQVTTAIVSRLKTLGRMNIAEKRRPQDGRMQMRLPNGGDIELRLSTLPTTFGEKLVLRLFDPQVLLKDFTRLGFTPEDLLRWRALLRQPTGIILVTGPTGSGKTTTLYTTLKELARPEINLCTIEDPIEMVEPSFNQMQVQHNIDLTFANGLRALMRQDPDVIMVGEIRDLETAQMAIQAALTGHLVLSTLHTNDATSAITRLLELGVAHYLIKATLLGVMAQRLIRLLCPHCKAPGTVAADDWQAITRPWRSPLPAQVQHAVGCVECRDTGYRGRAALYEILVLSESLKSGISASTDLARLRHQALKEGMRTLRLAGARKIAAGMTTLEEVLRVTPRHEGFGQETG
nr:GspE/PulE family protein [Pseudomonas sp. dw_358]